MCDTCTEKAEFCEETGQIFWQGKYSWSEALGLNIGVTCISCGY